MDLTHGRFAKVHQQGRLGRDGQVAGDLKQGVCRRAAQGFGSLGGREHRIGNPGAALFTDPEIQERLVSSTVVCDDRAALAERVGNRWR